MLKFTRATVTVLAFELCCSSAHAPLAPPQLNQLSSGDIELTKHRSRSNIKRKRCGIYQFTEIKQAKKKQGSISYGDIELANKRRRHFCEVFNVVELNADLKSARHIGLANINMGNKSAEHIGIWLDASGTIEAADIDIGTISGQSSIDAIDSHIQFTSINAH